MAEKKGKTNHDEFERVVEAVRELLSKPGEITLTEKQALSIVEHGNWWLEFRKARRDAAKEIKNPGRKKLPESELTPSAKRSRAAREAKKEVK